MIKTYLPWNTAHLSFQFSDSSGNSVQANSDVIVNVWENWLTSVLLENWICTLVMWDANSNNYPHTPVYNYVYDLVLSKEVPIGTYPITVTATVWTENRTLITQLVVWWAYVTIEEIKASKVGFDFSPYSDDQLTYASLLSKELIEAYCDRQRGIGTIVQKWETIVDNLGRIYLRFKSKPIVKVNYLKVRVPASVGIVLTPSYFDLFEQQGYGYYPISTAYGASAVGTYPLIVLGHMDKLLYRVEYDVEPNVPYMIKHASMLICINILKADYYYNSLGVADIIWPVNSFKTGSYQVQFDTNNTYSGKGYQWGQFLSPNVQELLDRYKVMKNNSF